jgi:hypothetical protein
MALQTSGIAKIRQEAVEEVQELNSRVSLVIPDIAIYMSGANTFRDLGDAPNGFSSRSRVKGTSLVF